jgi:hypothetical protein
MHDTSASWSNINFPLTEGKQRRGTREEGEKREKERLFSLPKPFQSHYSRANKHGH